MKTPILLLAAVLAAMPAIQCPAEEPAMKCPMCEKMKQEKQAAATAAKAKHELMIQTAELDTLVTAMNGSLGGEKLEAMAALLTRLVEVNKRLCKQLVHTQTASAKKVKGGKDLVADPESHEGDSAEKGPTGEATKEGASEHDNH